MEIYYILIVAVLFLLAVSDLVVGVSNDAVNFLNSALGSRAASFRIILSIAAAGILVGAVFSNGMMEVARRGIFNPGEFAFSEIMILFLAVMLTDVLLLDFFNTIALPTSTTVSIVFELLGSAVAVSLFTVLSGGGSTTDIASHIHTERAVLIISGIFLAVLIAFTVGILVMWFVRMAFTFRLANTSRYWSGLWGGISLTAILYFLLIKGAGSSTLVSGDQLAFIQQHSAVILGASFAGWTLLFQLLALFTRTNILKIIVLAGTFSLAMAFAGNDMVNFIGVPLAGWEAFKAFHASGGAEAGTFTMDALNNPVNTSLLFLVLAGVVMVITLRFSRKARSVTETEINLGRQMEGDERFASSLLARFLVRRSIEIRQMMRRLVPQRVSTFIDTRIRYGDEEEPADRQSAFDLVRASVNLVVAAILISIGTSLKLPLSTTYVTFMVAMGTSLADGAWGRESAVYRITGVLTVIGGWFVTAFVAFSASFIIASLLFLGKIPVMLFLVALSIFLLIRSHATHKKRFTRTAAETEEKQASAEILDQCNSQVKSLIIRVSKLLYLTYTHFLKEKYKEMKGVRKELNALNREIRELRDEIPVTLSSFKDSELGSGHHYVQVVDAMKETANSLYSIFSTAFRHLDNNHALDREQADVFGEFNEKTSEFFNYEINLLKTRNYDRMDDLAQQKAEILDLVNQIMVGRIKILKKKQKGVKVSVTYMEMLSETKSLINHSVQLLEANRMLLEAGKGQGIRKESGSLE